eukprot:366272-Chlamydomonas_euryale.AAC.3
MVRGWVWDGVWILEAHLPHLLQTLQPAGWRHELPFPGPPRCFIPLAAPHPRPHLQHRLCALQPAGWRHELPFPGPPRCFIPLAAPHPRPHLQHLLCALQHVADVDRNGRGLGAAPPHVAGRRDVGVANHVDLRNARERAVGQAVEVDIFGGIREKVGEKVTRQGFTKVLEFVCERIGRPGRRVPRRWMKGQNVCPPPPTHKHNCPACTARPGQQTITTTTSSLAPPHLPPIPLYCTLSSMHCSTRPTDNYHHHLLPSPSHTCPPIPSYCTLSSMYCSTRPSNAE